MSWAWPRYQHTTGYVLDIDEFNANMAEYAFETDGNLGEHNFGVAALQDRMIAGDVADDLVYTLHSTKHEVPPDGSVNAMTEVPHATHWVRVNRQKTFTSAGGSILVLISFQVHQPGTAPEQVGLNFCIELDGVPQMNSLIGTGDQGNEFIQIGAGLTVGDGAVEWDFGTAPAIKAKNTRLLCKGTYKVEPGRHTVRLLARNLAMSSSDVFQYIGNGEVIVVHLEQ